VKYLLPLLLVGCASMTEDDVEYRHTVDMANWINCQNVYLREGKPTYHRHHHKSRMKAVEIRDDVFVNSCRMVLGEEWIDY